MRFHTTHASEMLLRRYGIDTDDALWRQALLDVTARPPASLLLKMEPSGDEQHAVWMQGIAVRVVYSPRLAVFITVLPPVDSPYHRRMTNIAI